MLRGLVRGNTVTLFFSMFSFDYPENIINWKVLWCFQDDQKGTLRSKGLTSTAQKMIFFIKDFFSKCDQIRMKPQIWSHLLKNSLIENFIFCATIFFFSPNTMKKFRQCFLCNCVLSQNVMNASLGVVYLVFLQKSCS